MSPYHKPIQWDLAFTILRQISNRSISIPIAQDVNLQAVTLSLGSAPVGAFGIKAVAQALQVRTPGRFCYLIPVSLVAMNFVVGSSLTKGIL
jgi:hypothetical protein